MLANGSLFGCSAAPGRLLSAAATPAQGHAVQKSSVKAQQWLGHMDRDVQCEMLSTSIAPETQQGAAQVPGGLLKPPELGCVGGDRAGC